MGLSGASLPKNEVGIESKPDLGSNNGSLSIQAQSLEGTAIGDDLDNSFPKTGTLVELAILTDEISLDIDEALEEGKALGFRKFELRCADSYENRVPYLKAKAESRINQEVERKEIEITALTPGIFKIGLGDSQKIRKEMDVTLPKTCEMAVQLGAPRVIAFSFMTHEGGTAADAITLLKEAGKVAAEFGLQLSIENEPGFFCDTGVHTAAFVKEIHQSNVGVNWDTANALVSGEAAYPVGYDAVLPCIQNVHLKDGIPVPPDKWENRLIGDGGVNWVGQLQALIRDAPVSHVTMETHVFPVLESTRENLRRLKILLKTVEAMNQSASE